MTPVRSALVLALGLVVGVALGGGACTDVPAVAPEAFACVDDQPLADGTWPCPATHACVGGQCTPRLGCRGATEPGCDPGATYCGLLDRETPSVLACVPGALPPVPTSTTAGPGCACAPGFVCALVADVNGAPAAFVSAPYAASATVALPVGARGIGAERRAFRRCVRPCSGEADCPAGHTCHPAARLTDAVRAGTDAGRDTVGVCLIDLEVSTASAARALDPAICGYDGDCNEALGRPGRFCEARVEAIADHPASPLGAAWVDRRAVRSRCAPESARIDSGRGCIRDGDCKSGLCVASRCARICDPRAPMPCPSAQGCVDYPVEVAGVADRVYLCR